MLEEPTISCPQCHTPLDPEDRYCTNCGARLDIVPPETGGLGSASKIPAEETAAPPEQDKALTLGEDSDTDKPSSSTEDATIPVWIEPTPPQEEITQTVESAASLSDNTIPLAYPRETFTHRSVPTPPASSTKPQRRRVPLVGILSAAIMLTGVVASSILIYLWKGTSLELPREAGSDSTLTVESSQSIPETKEAGAASETQDVIAKGDRQQTSGEFQRQAQESLEAGDLDTALAQVSSGLAAIPDDRELLRLRSEIESIKGLQARAESYLVAGRLSKPPGENARDIYRSILNRYPGNKAAQDGLQRIAQQYTELTREQIKSGDFKKAATLAASGLEVVPDYPDLRNLQNEINRRQGLASRLQDLLKQGDGKLRAIPNEQNVKDALEAYEAALALDPSGAAARAGIAKVAELARVQAVRNQKQGKPEKALDYVNLGLRASPEHAELRALKEQILGKPEIEQILPKPEIEQILAQADQAVAAEPFIAEKALDLYRQVLKIDRNNQRAKKGLSQIAERCQQIAEQRIASGALEAAKSYIRLGLQAVPQQAALLDLKSKIEASLTTQGGETKSDEIKAFESFAHERGKKAAEYIKKSGHSICIRRMGYREGNEIKYFETFGDFRRKGFFDVDPKYPDTQEVCFGAYDCETNAAIEGVCFFAREFPKIPEMR